MEHFNLNIHNVLYLRELLALLIFCFSLSFLNICYCSLSIYIICMFADLVAGSYFRLATRFICISNYCQGLSSLAHSSSPQDPVVTSRFQDRWEAPYPPPLLGKSGPSCNRGRVIWWWHSSPDRPPPDQPLKTNKQKPSGSVCALELPYLLVSYLNCKTRVFHFLNGATKQAVHTPGTSVTHKLKREQ